jgi:hypothetical protein
MVKTKKTLKYFHCYPNLTASPCGGEQLLTAKKRYVCLSEFDLKNDSVGCVAGY